MKTLIHAAVTAAALAVLPAVSSAALITINSTTPDWTNVTGGTNISEGWNGVGNSAFYDIRWGTSTGSGPSGLGFDPYDPPATDYNTDVAIRIGDLRHYNNPIAGGSAASAVTLNLTSAIAGATPVNQTFAFRFTIDETPNVTPCAYPSTTPCADRITFQNLDLTSSFTVGGQAYTIELLGFGSSANSILSYFDSQEGGTNTVGLWAKITAPSRVPEPATLGLVAMALLGAGVVGKRRRHS